MHAFSSLRNDDAQPHLQILKRTGGVLLATGLVDIAVMIYCIANRISYSSSFNIFAVVAGVFLLRGNLQAASIVRLMSSFMLGAFLALLVAWPFVYPVDLTLTQLRLNPGASVLAAAFVTFGLALLSWLIWELGREPVQAARAAAGRRARDIRAPAAIGVGLVVVTSILLTLLSRGESAARARAMAEQQLGPGFRYHVSSLSIAKNHQGTFVSGMVTAWNEKEIKDVPVRWKD